MPSLSIVIVSRLAAIQFDVIVNQAEFQWNGSLVFLKKQENKEASEKTHHQKYTAVISNSYLYYI